VKTHQIGAQEAASTQQFRRSCLNAMLKPAPQQG
jgi:hypothetical protein